ncbi:hypothetical protein [Candidatus Poriferisodalis sp.]|uniref:hypothetical protein n=1 Tax=Candidatus Poriferisodalis sp. TaxID=3101277 RepID=UPI003B01B792
MTKHSPPMPPTQQAPTLFDSAASDIGASEFDAGCAEVSHTFTAASLPAPAEVDPRLSPPRWAAPTLVSQRSEPAELDLRHSNEKRDCGEPLRAARRAPNPPNELEQLVLAAHDAAEQQPSTAHSRTADAPAVPPVRSLGISRSTLRGETAQSRRHRSLARLAKRRYLVDAEGYARMEQIRSALRLIQDHDPAAL